MNNQVKLSIACLVFAVVCDANADSITYFDGDFEESNWSLTTFFHGNGGTATGSQAASGGNPDSYFLVENTVADAPGGDFSSVWAFFSSSNATYNPTTQGPIATIDSSQNAIVFSDLAQSIRVGVKQDGNFFAAGGAFPNTSTWTQVEFLDLTENDFAKINPTQGFPDDPNANPDFSSAGSPIEFGFLRTISTSFGGEGATTLAGVDNWSLTVNQVPEPSTFIVIVSCTMSLLLRRSNSCR